MTANTPGSNGSNGGERLRRDAADRARWRRYLANERAEARVYRELAARRTGEDRTILLALAEAEGRHEAHWLGLLHGDDGGLPRADLRTRMLAVCARRFGMVFVLALTQRAEARSPYESDPDATAAMAADERIHGEVVRALAGQGRRRLSGSFRAAVFGLNDGLVSNLALVLGIGATGVATPVVLFTGIAGLLAGAFSMATGEYVSVRSQRELLASAAPELRARDVVLDLDFDANELSLIYRARGLSEADAARQAARMVTRLRERTRMPDSGADDPVPSSPEKPASAPGPSADHTGGFAPATGTEPTPASDDTVVGSPMGAAASSFVAFACGALVPVLPYLVGVGGLTAVVVAAALVGAMLLITGGIVGILSGETTLRPALRQLAIGFGAAAVTYVLGCSFGAALR